MLVSSDDFDVGGATLIQPPVLFIFLVRVEVNPVMRARWSAVGAADGRSHLPLDLHFLLTPWASNAEHEHRILGSAIRYLDEPPVLSGPLLSTTHRIVRRLPCGAVCSADARWAGQVVRGGGGGR